VLDLRLPGETKPIAGTLPRPFWSVDCNDRIPNGALPTGERLAAKNGSTPGVLELEKQEELLVVHNASVGDKPCPPSSAQDCEAEVITATNTDFELRNNNKLQNYIIGEVNAAGELSFWVENLPADGTGCPGWWMFNQTMEHFQMTGTSISIVAGYWVYGDNLATVNKLTAGDAMTLEEAAKQTRTGGYAMTWQFTNVEVVYPAPGNPKSLGTIGTQGNYSKVYVRFKH